MCCVWRLRDVVRVRGESRGIYREPMESFASSLSLESMEPSDEQAQTEDQEKTEETFSLLEEFRTSGRVIVEEDDGYLD